MIPDEMRGCETPVDEFKDSIDLISEIVETSLSNLETDWMQNHEKNMTPHHFFDQFRNIKIKLQRRAGHTQAAIKLLNRYPNSLIIVEKEAAKGGTINDIFRHSSIPDHLIDQVRNFYNDSIISTSVMFTTGSKLSGQLFDKNTSYDLVIVDRTDRHTKEHMDYLHSLAMDKTKLFVELQ